MSDGQIQKLPLNSADVISGDDRYDPDSPQWAKLWCNQKNKYSFIQDSKAAASEDSKVHKKKKKKKHH